MAGRKSPPLDDEKKSYGALWLVLALLTFLGSLWAIADDNLFRRPWKFYQANFNRLEISRVKDAIKAEDDRLAALPEYQEAVKQLEQAKAAVDAKAVAKLEAELTVDRENDLTKDLNVRFVKSELEELRFFYDDALHHGHPVEEIKAKIDSREALLAERTTIFKDSQDQIAGLESQVKTLDAGVKKVEDHLATLTATRDELQLKLEGISLGKFPGPMEVPPYFGSDWQPKIPKIQQVVLEEFDRNKFNDPVARVDRCVSCHIAIDKPGFEDQENPAKTHPHRDTLLAKHPGDRFGCTSCHNGQGEAVNSPETAHGNFIDAHGHLEQVEFIPFPMHRDERVQANCIHCHESVQNLTGAEYIAKGEQLFSELGCHGCHLAEGYADLAKHSGTSVIAPSLRRVASKVDPGWLVRWIENPQAFRPRTRMPNFYFDETQSMQTAAYLLSVSREPGAEWLAANADPQLGAATVEKGKELVDSLGCRACHGLSDGDVAGQLSETKDIAPNLSAIAEKTNARWIYGWIRSPRGYSHVARMPNLRLTDVEAGSITKFLLTLGEKKPAPAGLDQQLADPANVAAGEKLVRRYGCAGCHDIPGMENESRVSVELSTFGDKTKEELFFGDRADLPETWLDWTYAKLEDPRTFQTTWIEQAMPNFKLAPDEIKALRAFLASRTERRPPGAYRYSSKYSTDIVEGQRLVARYNCTGCHLIEGKGGGVRRLYEDKPTMAPPNLNTEGAKVQQAWLFDFLKKPTPIRPWLHIRMPTFGLDDEEAAQIIRYFQSLDAVDVPFVHLDRASFSHENVEAGKMLASEDYLNCFSCHVRGSLNPQGSAEDWAPDLSMAYKRLNPEWVVRWINDPQGIMPGSKMPSFYPDPAAPDGPPDVLGGDDDAQIRALRDYLMTLGMPAASPAQSAGVGSGGSAQTQGG